MGLITERAMARLSFGSRLLKRCFSPFEIFPEREKVPEYVRQDFLRQMVSQLVKRRHELRLSGAVVDARIGCTEYLVAKWECGIRAPSAFNLMCWAEALGCEWVLVPKHPDRTQIEKQNR